MGPPLWDAVATVPRAGYKRTGRLPAAERFGSDIVAEHSNAARSIRLGPATVTSLLLGLANGGCTTAAQMVNNPGQDAASPYAPVKRSAPQTGIIKYSADGPSLSVQQRKDDAYRQMHTACSGFYEITTEELVKDGATASVLDNQNILGSNVGLTTATAQSLSSWVIQFQCVPPVAGAPQRPRVTPRTYDECHAAGGQWVLFISECKLPDEATKRP